MSALVVVETVDFPENLSITSSNSLGVAFGSYYLVPRLPRFSAAKYRTWKDVASGRTEYYWTMALPPGLPSSAPASVNTHVIITPQDVRVQFTSVRPLEEGEKTVLAGVTDDIREFVAEFLEFAKRSTLYVVIPPYPRSSLEKEKSTQAGNEALRRIFTGNTTNVFLLALLVTLPAFLFIGVYAFVLMVGVQAIALYYSDRIALRSGSVLPSAERPRGTVVGVALRKSLPAEVKPAPRVIVPKLRTGLEDAVAEAEATGGSVRTAAVKVLREAGVNCSEEDIEVTTRDVYGLVERAARRFGLPTPKVVVTDTKVSNAAATGISPRRASMMITAGSLEGLNDPELEAVIGHELGHIRGRDPTILMGLTAVLYLGAVFVWPSVLVYLGLGYFLLAFVLIYVVGKVLETRADTMSAAVLGRPDDLASALTDIAFEELYTEKRSSPARFLRWVSFDSHPPVYFRVERLAKMASSGVPTRHFLLTSARDCFAGFFGSVLGRE